jgi:hypothetical protein
MPSSPGDVVPFALDVSPVYDAAVAGGLTYDAAGSGNDDGRLTAPVVVFGSIDVVVVVEDAAQKRSWACSTPSCVMTGKVRSRCGPSGIGSAWSKL